MRDRRGRTDEGSATENDNSFSLPLILPLEMNILHHEHRQQRRYEHEDGDTIQHSLRIDVTLVDGESDGRAGLEGKDVGEGGHDLGDHIVVGRREVQMETHGK
jgi:hypothetical protein